METFTVGDGVVVYHSDASKLYEEWESPIVIVSDGPYGIKGFPGDPPTYEELDTWYEPHIEAWSKKATPQTTLWFWNTEVGWATVHPILVKYGWIYRACHIWDKGKQHIAGNVNSKSLRKLPIVTEVCAQYVKAPTFYINSKPVGMKEWLRHEWGRTGLPFSVTNKACGVKDAATRKYFTKCHLWYYPPPEAFDKIANYANIHGKEEGRPYFSRDGESVVTKEEWARMRAKFECPFSVTNVWREPPLNGDERIKNGFKSVHLNQKPLNLIKLTIEASSEVADLVWEPFGGLCTTALASYQLNRRCVAAEINESIFKEAVKRLTQNRSIQLKLGVESSRH